MRKAVFFILIIITSLAACSRQGVKVDSANQEYSVTLTPTMHKAQGINKDAEMQYIDEINGISFFVIRDRKTDFEAMMDTYCQDSTFVEDFNIDLSNKSGLENYCKMVSTILENESLTFKILSQKDSIVNGLNCRILEINSGLQTEKRIETSYMQMCIYEGSNYFYQTYAVCDLILTPQNQHDMVSMTESLVEKQ